MEKEKPISVLVISAKQHLNLYFSTFAVLTKKTFTRKRKEYKYEEIEKIRLELIEANEYVESEGRFANFHIDLRKKGFISFDLYEESVKELKYAISKILAFVGSFKACISGNNQKITETDFKKELVEPEIVILEPKGLDYRKLIKENKAENPVLINNKEQKMLE